MIVGQGLKTYFFFSAFLYFIYLSYHAITDFFPALTNFDDYLTFIIDCLLILYFIVCIKIINKGSNIYFQNGKFFIKNDNFKSSKSLKIALFYILNSILMICLTICTITLFATLLKNIFYSTPNKHSTAIWLILLCIFLNYLIFFNHLYFKDIKIWNFLKKINFYSALLIICSQIIATLQVFYFSNSTAQNNQKFYIFLIQTSLILAAILVLFFISWKKAPQNSEKTNKILSPQNDIFLQKTLNLTDEINELL